MVSSTKRGRDRLPPEPSSHGSCAGTSGRRRKRHRSHRSTEIRNEGKKSQHLQYFSLARSLTLRKEKEATSAKRRRLQSTRQSRASWTQPREPACRARSLTPLRRRKPCTAKQEHKEEEVEEGQESPMVSLPGVQPLAQLKDMLEAFEQGAFQLGVLRHPLQQRSQCITSWCRLCQVIRSKEALRGCP